MKMVMNKKITIKYIMNELIKNLNLSSVKKKVEYKINDFNNLFFILSFQNIQIDELCGPDDIKIIHNFLDELQEYNYPQKEKLIQNFGSFYLRYTRKRKLELIKKGTTEL